MGANTGTIKLELVVDDKGSVTLSNAALKGISALDGLRVKSGTVARFMRSSFDTVKSGIGSIIDRLMNWKTALAGLVGAGGFGLLARQTIGVASSFENMRLSLDTMTKGQGAATLNQLNEWALKMPVNTQKAVQSFIMMKAMGLDPTIAQMTTLVDTMSALGGSAEVLEGIARALGQIQTKGKVSAEELMQLAERGVPVFEILRERFGEVDTSTLNAAQAIEAIFAGLDERFGGMSKKQQSAWSGMIESVKSYWTEFQRLIMESGLFDYLKEKVSGIVDWLDRAKWSGQMQDFAKGISDWIVPKLKEAEQFVGDIKVRFEEWKPVLKDVAAFLGGIGTVIKGVAAAFNVVGKGIGNAAGWAVTEFEAQRGAFQAGMGGSGAAPTEPEAEAGWRPFMGGASPTTVNNYFNENISRSDAVAIATETERQSYRDGE